ncbi:UNVERIFIED_CONTAM: Slc22a1 [Trichonephila clavipes]
MFPFFLFESLRSLVPESPRWLLTRGKTTKFNELVEKAARVNGKVIKGDVKDLIHSEIEADNQKDQTLLYIFKWPKMKNRALNCFYIW